MTARSLTARQHQLPGDPAQDPGPAAARRGGHHHDPRPGPGRARVPGERAADPGGDPGLCRDRDRADLPPDTVVRVAGERDADRQRGGADPARGRHAGGRPLVPLRLVGVRGHRRAVAAQQVRDPLSRLARVQPVQPGAGCGLPRPRQLPDRAARLLVGPARCLDAAGLRGDHRRRAVHHAAAPLPRPGGDLLDHVRGGPRDPGRLRALHGRELGVRARVRGRLLARDRHLARGPRSSCSS